jgi:hypothetical protein
MPLVTALGWTAAIIIPLLWLVFLIRYRATTRGSLFSGRITSFRRVLALFLGLVLAGLVLITQSVELGFVALLLLLYGFGRSDTLRGIQPAPAYRVSSQTTLIELRNVAMALLTIALTTVAFLALIGWMLTNQGGQIVLVALVLLGSVAAITLSIVHVYNVIRKL